MFSPKRFFWAFLLLSALFATSAKAVSTVTFSTQPSALRSLIAGSGLSLTAATTSPSAVTYQWFRNAVAIPAATSASFSKTPVTINDAGLYTLVATNNDGSVTSSPSLVVVRAQPGRVLAGQVSSGRPVFNANPFAILALPDGGALVGGLFSNVNSSGIDYLVRLRPDGSLDTSFNLALSNTVLALHRQPDGKILVGGTFSQAGASSAVSLLRLNSDLTLDTAFSAKVGAFLFRYYLTGYAVRDIALDSTGRIYIGIGDIPGAIHRFASDGTRDEAYAPAVDQMVGVLAMQAGDKLLVGGYFNSLAGSPAPRLGRLNSDGTRDGTFISELGGSADLKDLLVLKDGRIFAAGANFSNAATMAELGGTGAFASNLGSGNQAYKLVQGPDGKILGARASSSGSGSVFRLKGTNPLPIPGSADGDPTFNVGTGPNADVLVADFSPDGSIWLAGVFTTFDGFASGGVIKLGGDPANPAILNQPVRTDVNVGATARFSVGAFGTGLTYQWLRNGAVLANDTRFSGVTTAVLTITDVVAANSGSYSVQVSGGSPKTTLTSAAVKLNVLAAPVVVASPPAVTPVRGSTVTLAPDVLAASPANYVWTRDGVTIIDGGRYSGATTAKLVITGASAIDNGSYVLKVTNPLGTASTTAAKVTVTQVNTTIDPAFSLLSSASSAVNAILPLPDGRTLVGRTSSNIFNGAAGTSSYFTLNLVLSNGRIDPAFNSQVYGSIRTLTRLPNGKIIVTGDFTSIFGATRNRIARLNADLTLDTTFDAGSSANSSISAVQSDSLDRLYVGGSFTGFGGSTYNYLVRLKTSGAVDTSFTVTVNSTVSFLQPLPNGAILVGGFFNQVNGATPVKYLFRLKEAGTYDPTFTSAAASPVAALATDASGRAYVGYDFSPTSASLVRLLAGGGLDLAFAAPTKFTNSISSIAVQSDGRVLVQTYADSANKIFRVLSNGVLDTAFVAPTVNSGVLALALDPQGRIWLGGGFTSYNGVGASSMAVLHGDGVKLGFVAQPVSRTVNVGASSAQFSAIAIGGNGFTYQWKKDGIALVNSTRITGATSATLTVKTLVATDAGKYTLTLTNAGGAVTSRSAALTVLTKPEILASPKSPVTADIAGKVVLSGSARGAGTLAYQWFRGTTALTNGTVGGLTISGATTGTLTLTGVGFASAGSYTLRVTNTHGVQTSAAALLNIQRRPGALAGDITQPSFNSQVYAIKFLSDGSYLVGGSFTSVTVKGVTTSRSRLARFLANGSLDTTFAPAFNGNVRAIAVDSSNRIFVGGDFTSVTIGATATSRIRVARFTSTRVLDTAFNTATAGPNGGSASVLALAPVGDGSVYVGGQFTAIGTVATPAVNRLARLKPTGALDTSFTSGASNDVNAIVRLSTGVLYVGGSSNTWGGTVLLPGNPMARLVKLSATGARSTFPSPDAFTIVNTLLPLADGTLLVGGNYFGQPYLRRIAATDGVDKGLTTPAHLSQINAVAQQADGKILSGALGTFVRSDLANKIDTSFGSFNSSMITALAVDASGRIYVGGAFAAYDGIPAGCFAILNGGAPKVVNGSSVVATSGALLAPSALPVGSSLTYNGTGLDSRTGAYSETATVTIGQGGTIAEGGTYTYVATADDVATLSYKTTVKDAQGVETETSSLTLTFTSPTAGTFTSAGTYHGTDDVDGAYSGTFTQTGTFTYRPKP